MVMYFTRALAFAASVLLMTPGPALAQSRAVLQGKVTDPNGAVVPNTIIVVRNEATSLERTTQTDEDGNYQVAALPVGTYQIEVKAKGFQTATISNFSIEV